MKIEPKSIKVRDIFEGYTDNGDQCFLKVADLVLGNENTVKVNTEGEDRLETIKVDEKEAYEQIKEELGIEPVQLQYMPAGMELYIQY